MCMIISMILVNGGFLLFLCAARIPVNQTAYIRSENYPAPYPRDQFSVFTGEAEDGLHALVEFFDFDLQAGDSLTFGCGANPYDDLSVVATFTGGEIPPPLTLECASIWFSLSTTSSEGDNRGFFGSITTVAPDGKYTRVLWQSYGLHDVFLFPKSINQSINDDLNPC